VLALVAVLALGLLLAFCFRPAPAPAPGAARLRELAAHARRVAGRPRTWRLLAFAALGGAGFEVVGALLGPFVLDAGASERALATFYALPAWIAPVLGGFVGGLLADRRGPAPAVAWTGAALALAVLAVAALAGGWRPGPELGEPPSAAPLLAALAVVYLGIGAFTASSYALFMAETDPALGSTQFSAFMGATNLCESWSAAGGGRLAAATGLPGTRGYGVAFAALAAVSLAALLLLPRGDGARGTGCGGKAVDGPDRRASDPRSGSTAGREPPRSRG
jgi:predicted MFS family arabinose efflux permease